MTHILKALYNSLRGAVTGQDSSESMNIVKANSKRHQRVSVNLPLPLDVVEVILSYVPTEDLLENCIFVEQWTDIINSHSIWLLKCTRKWKRVVRPDPIPDNFYRCLYGMPFGVNLIENPCGKQNLDKWTVTINRGDGWRIEHPPDGADPIPDTECQYCFVTSFGKCEKYQQINLEDWNVTVEMMNIVKPEIHISEWHAARWDCGSKYHLQVSLLDETFTVLDRFIYNYIEPQWTGRQWQQTQHVFSHYPDGVRYISFLHRGRDTQFWKGYYGSKMARASVTLAM